MRSKQHLVAVRPEEKVLALETMFFHDEVRDPTTELGTLPGELTFKPREMDTAKLLIDSMSAEWNADNYADTYRQRVEELIDRKRQGEIVVTGGDTRPAAPVVDLMDALQASVKAARNHRPGNADVSPLVPASGGKKAKAAPAAGRRATTGRKSGEDLSALSKTELAKRAAALGIEGRSKMSREELESAVAATTTASSAPARRRKAS
jgi:DNA end-binding protein Ku